MSGELPHLTSYGERRTHSLWFFLFDVFRLSQECVFNGWLLTGLRVASIRTDLRPFLAPSW